MQRLATSLCSSSGTTNMSLKEVSPSHFFLFQLAKRKKYPAMPPLQLSRFNSNRPYLTKNNRRLGHVHYPSHEPNVPDPLPGNKHQYGHGIPPDLDLAPHPRRPTRPDTVQPP